MKVIAKAPAKINLYLDILEKTADDYHNVEMIMQTVSLYDLVTVEPNNIEKIVISSNKRFAGSITKNTAYKAAYEFFDFTKIKNPGININLEKKIPVCAGLAGGSSDAAATLVALNKIFDTRLSKCELAKIGKNVGADVPFCIFGGTMKSTGIGTVLSPLTYMPKCFIVLSKPNIFVSTKKAYELSDNFNICKKSMAPIVKAINNRSISDIAQNLYNHFEIVLNLPEVCNIKNIMLQEGALSSCMSGSGPTVFGIFNDKTAASNCVNFLHRSKKHAALCEPIKFGAVINS